MSQATARPSASPRRVKLPERIQTPRLVLRPWRATDAPLLSAAINGNLDHLRAWMAWARNESHSLPAIEQRIDRFDRAFRSDSEWLYAIFSDGEAQLFGGAGLHRGVERGGLEIGFWLQKAWTKQGYATEAVRALTDVAFSLPDVQRVQIRCDPRNESSAAVARRAGFQHVTTLKNVKVDAKEPPRDSMVWELARPAAPKAAESHATVSGAHSFGDAALSLVIPGLGQLVQRRWLAAALQLTTVIAYVVAALQTRQDRAVILAAAWNLWSAVDAYLHRRRRDAVQ